MITLRAALKLAAAAVAVALIPLRRPVGDWANRYSLVGVDLATLPDVSRLWIVEASREWNDGQGDCGKEYGYRSIIGFKAEFRAELAEVLRENPNSRVTWEHRGPCMLPPYLSNRIPVCA